MMPIKKLPSKMPTVSKYDTNRTIKIFANSDQCSGKRPRRETRFITYHLSLDVRDKKLVQAACSVQACTLYTVLPMLAILPYLKHLNPYYKNGNFT
jgi:hypothetical protein